MWGKIATTHLQNSSHTSRELAMVNDEEHQYGEQILNEQKDSSEPKFNGTRSVIGGAGGRGYPGYP